MNNPETRATLGTKHITNTNKTNNTKQKTKKDEQQEPQQKTRDKLSHEE
jgi:hypothetical protein